MKRVRRSIHSAKLTASWSTIGVPGLMGLMSPRSTFPTCLREATQPVFHYTSSAGLLGIAEHHGLWASEAGGLNDVAEVRQGWEFVRSWLDAQPTCDAIAYLQDLATKPLKQPHEVFVLCASTDGDDANQWRLYADGGRGYVVELDTAVDLSVRSLTDSAAGSKGPGVRARDWVTVNPWLHVLYDEADRGRAMKEVLDHVVRELRRFDEGEYDDDPEAGEHAGEDLQADAYEALATIAHLVKTSGFRGENEVRLVATFLWGDGNVRYRAGAYGIVGYVLINARPDGHMRRSVIPSSSTTRPLPLRSVRLGPLVHAESRDTVRGLLRANGYTAAEVKVSAVPLR